MLEQRQQSRVLAERAAIIMGTRCSVHMSCEPECAGDAEAAVEACLAWLREVERCLTRFNPASELCRLNAASGRWHDASETLFTVVEQSVAAAEASGGLFDPTILPALERAGYDRDIAALPAAPEHDAADPVAAVALEPGRWREIELDHAGRRVRLPAGARLDFGGIAKGWAADEALSRFFADLPGVLINVGGDMRASGHNAEGEPWAVGIGNPRAGAEEHVAVISLARGGVACSGATDRWWYQGNQRRHHLIDPRTMAPADLWLDESDGAPDAGERIATATALAPTAAHAEIAAKVALLRGYPEALRAVEAAWTGVAGVLRDRADAAYADAPVALLLVLGSGQVAASSNLADYAATWGGGGDVWLD